MFFFSIYLILLAALGLGDYSASNRNEYQKCPVRRAGNLATIYEPII
jgi:hypothetical protein